MLDQFFSCYKAPFTLRKDHRSEEYIYIILALYSLQWFIDIARRRKIAAWRVNITNMHNYIEGTKGWHAVCCCASIDIRHERSISCTRLNGRLEFKIFPNLIDQIAWSPMSVAVEGKSLWNDVGPTEGTDGVRVLSSTRFCATAPVVYPYPLTQQHCSFCIHVTSYQYRGKNVIFQQH